MSFLTFDDLKLTFNSRVKRSKRFQRSTFGDGYSQVVGDGLNAEKETWTCQTPAVTEMEAFSIESALKKYADSAITWTPPDATKTFESQFAAGAMTLGYTNLQSLSLSGYTRPTNYTANLVTGILTSITIPNNVAIKITLTENPKQYLLRDGWELSYIAPKVYQISFELERIYV
jgi:phage-related protein